MSLVQRARVLLWAGEGMANTRIAEKAGVMPDTVRTWRARHATDGLAQFAAMRPGRGRKPSIPPEKVAAIVEATLHTKPKGRRTGAAARWPRRRGSARRPCSGSGRRAA